MNPSLRNLMKEIVERIVEHVRRISTHGAWNLHIKGIKADIQSDIRICGWVWMLPVLSPGVATLHLCFFNSRIENSLKFQYVQSSLFRSAQTKTCRFYDFILLWTFGCECLQLSKVFL